MALHMVLLLVGGRRWSLHHSHTCAWCPPVPTWSPACHHSRPRVLPPCTPATCHVAWCKPGYVRSNTQKCLLTSGREGSPLRWGQPQGRRTLRRAAAHRTAGPSGTLVPRVHDVDAQLLQHLCHALDALRLQRLESLGEQSLGVVGALVVAQRPAQQPLHGTWNG